MNLNEDIIIIDTETTGVDHEKDKVIEIAAIRVSPDWEIIDTFEQLIDPEMDIPPEASAVHHLTARDVIGKPTMPDVLPALFDFVGDTVLAAHNAQFDSGMLPQLTNKWLCTLRLAKHMFPTASSRKVQALRYMFGLIDIDLKGLNPHRALADILVTLEVFKEMIQRHGNTSIADLIEFADSPIDVKIMPFGKHRGEPLIAVPQGYKSWALKNIGDMDPDLRASIEKSM